MKLICLSDIHLTSFQPQGRKDNILKAGLNKLKFVLKYADKINADIIQAGDFCDKARDWNLLSKLIPLLKKYMRVRIYTIRGQHDSYYRSSQKSNATTMSILNKMGLVIIVEPDRTYEITDDWNLYGCGWGEQLKMEPSSLFNILITHAPISENIIYPNQKFTPPKKFLELHKKFNLILTGDIHRNFISTTENSILVNTGPILRLEANKFNMQHRPFFYVFDTNYLSLEKIQITHKPAEKVLNREHLEIEYNNEDNKILELSKKISESIEVEAKNGDVFNKLLSNKKLNIRKGVRNALQEAHDAIRHSGYEKKS